MLGPLPLFFFIRFSMTSPSPPQRTYFLNDPLYDSRSQLADCVTKFNASRNKLNHVIQGDGKLLYISTMMNRFRLLGFILYGQLN